MHSSSSQNAAGTALLLGVDTCGPAGSVALGLLRDEGVEVLGQIELEGRTYSSTLLGAISQLLEDAGRNVADLACIVAVSGPGSFTGVRVGLSAVKGLAEGAGISVVAVSRLEVLAEKAGSVSAALDAHRHEVFLRLDRGGEPVEETLAGAAELAALGRGLSGQGTRRIAVCDEPAGELLNEALRAVELIRVAPPTAVDALILAAPRIRAGEFCDVALLDGHYLRRSDAEIFGEPVKSEVGQSA